ncbi:MAG: phosphoserine phosphatase SerB [bacterium]|nr:phosphoserine phosphatase SerB [bacterium]
MNEILLINVSGPNRPGLTSSITAILARYDVAILDIGQAVIHNTLSLGFLVQLVDAAESAALKDLVFRAYELGVEIRFTPITEADYGDWVAQQQNERYIVTLLGPRITAAHISAITAIVADGGLDVSDISRLSGRMPLHPDHRHDRTCVQLTVGGHAPDLGQMRSRFLHVSAEQGIDVAFQVDDVYRRNRRLVAFDMDSTLVQCEVIDELAIAAGVGTQVAAITAQAMNGELDFRESFVRRLALLEGLPEAVLAQIAARLPLADGAERLVANLKSLGYRIAILSGGFTYFAEYLQRRLGIDYVYANELEIVDGKLTGRVVGDIVDGARKARLVEEIARRENIRLQQVIAVGDGANDLPMLSIAGLGIAFHAKPVVHREARQSISSVGLDGILYLMGVRDREAQD